MAFVSFEKYALMSLVLADAVEHEPKKRKKGEHVLAWVRPENSSDHRNVLLSPPKSTMGPAHVLPLLLSARSQATYPKDSCYEESYHLDKMTVSSPWRV